MGLFHLLVVVSCCAGSSRSGCYPSCTCTTTTVRCNHKLVHFPSVYPREVDHFDLSGNLLESLPRSLPQLGSLKVLLLSRNRISKLPPTSLSSLFSLELLDLSQNRIKSLQDLHSSTVFDMNNELKVLNLSGNPLKGLEDSGRGELRSYSVETVDLSHCSVRRVGKGSLSALHSLRTLDLSANPLEEVGLLVSPTLRVLYLNRTSLRYLGAGFGEDLPSLQYLDLSDNAHLSTIATLASHSLQHLLASSCTLKNIEVSGLPDLRTLKLESNTIKEIPPRAFKHSPKLYSVLLYGNAVSYLEEGSLTGCPALRELDISFNRLLGYQRESFLQLRVVNLSGNPLRHLGDVGSPGLVVLDASGCALTGVSPTLLSGLPALEELRLSHNDLRSWPAPLSSPALRSLDLSYNALSELRLGPFPALLELDLRANALREPPPWLPRGTRLEGNPWECDCGSERYGELEGVVCPSGESWRRRCGPKGRTPPWLPALLSLSSLALLLAVLYLLRRPCAAPGPPPRPPTPPPPPPPPPQHDPLPSYEEALLLPSLKRHAHATAQTSPEQINRSLADVASKSSASLKLSSSF